MAEIVRREAIPRRELAAPFGRRMLQDLSRWDPFAEVDRLLGRPTEGLFWPDFDVSETPDTHVLKADLPGVLDEDVEVTVTGNRITIRGHREEEQVAEGENYYVCERAAGRFSRSFTLPEGSDTDHVQAELRNGVLTLRVPKRPEVKARKVQIAAAEAGAEAGAPTKPAAEAGAAPKAQG